MLSLCVYCDLYGPKRLFSTYFGKFSTYFGKFSTYFGKFSTAVGQIFIVVKGRILNTKFSHWPHWL